MRRGFTLVELMVVVTIGLLLVGGMSLGISGFLGRERVLSASKDLVSILNLARNFAVTNQVPSGFTGLDYVAVTLSSSGTVTVYPVNHTSGIGASYVSKNVGTAGISFTQINFGGLQFAAGSGKLVGKNADPSYVSYPLSAATSVGITVSSAEVSQIRQITINPFGSIDSL
jgi:prepilin-type N-terminal cleavage/methylation domain-containing protein